MRPSWAERTGTGWFSLSKDWATTMCLKESNHFKRTLIMWAMYKDNFTVMVTQYEREHILLMLSCTAMEEIFSPFPVPSIEPFNAKWRIVCQSVLQQGDFPGNIFGACQIRILAGAPPASAASPGACGETLGRRRSLKTRLKGLEG